MLKSVLSFFTITKSKNDFELANLKDFSSYSFDELLMLLKDFDFIITIENDIKSVKFESEFSYIEIKYTNSGNFIEIVDQYWK